MINASEINVSYNKKEVLKNVSFQADSGALTAIVGPNGSGKTTLLKALTGDIKYSGTVIQNGHDTRSSKVWELAQERAVLPQSTPLSFPFTVIEVVRLGLTARAYSEPDLELRALSRVGLGGFEGRFFQELSGGEQQRVHLARVLAQVWEPVENGVPRWLFLDEPVSSLDIGHQLQVMQIARNYADAGGGVVAVMHDLNLTSMFADNVALISSGKIVGQGKPEKIISDELLSAAYGCALKVNTFPVNGTYVLPHAAAVAAE